MAAQGMGLALTGEKIMEALHYAPHRIEQAHTHSSTSSHDRYAHCGRDLTNWESLDGEPEHTDPTCPRCRKWLAARGRLSEGADQ